MTALRVARFARAYARGYAPREEEVRIPTSPGEAEATLHLPRRGTAAFTWVVLPGITVRGRHHPALLRLVRAVAAAGGAVLVPDVPAWRALRIDPAAAADTLVGALHWLERDPRTPTEDLSVLGFSFGATHALIAAAHPELRDRVHGVLGFGGYADLGRTLRCMMTGEHEWGGETFRLRPDPYGRWVAAANYLPLVPGMGDMEAVAVAARRLATEAGHRGAFADETVYDPLKREIRAELSAAGREVWDLLAPPAKQLPADLPAARELADALAAAALADQPVLDPTAALPQLRARVTLAHGRGDRLVPFTETLRLRAAFASSTDAAATLTGLLAHSGADSPGGPLRHLGEQARFLRLLARALTPRHR